MFGVMVLYFVIEAISRHSVSEAFSYMTERPLVFLYNSFLIFTTTMLVYLVRRRVFMRVLLTIFWLGLGIINGVLLANRVTPFTGPDLHLITDAVKIANKYLNPFFFVIVMIIAILVLIAMIILFVKGPRYRGKLRYRVNIPFVLIVVLAFAGTTRLALDKRVLSNYFGNIAFAYQDYGYPYCLATTIFNTGISCPRDYSESAINEIEDSESNLPKTGEKRPNIIFLQLESFFDPTLVNYLNVSEDPIPNFRKLMKEYSSGYYKVPSVGAGTANTEFESITGMSLHYFGPGEYPYKSILKETTCESAPYVLKSLGYRTHAIHNNEANFYGRKSVFANLGFDTFTSEEYMSEQDDTNPNDWMRDRNLTKYIMQALNETDDPDYIYTISVQGHGDYPTTMPEGFIPGITVSGFFDEEEQVQFEYYVNQIHEMDTFIGELTNMLSRRNEETVLVMYGDHLPTFNFTNDTMENGDIYQTEYFIWSNYGLEKKDIDLQAYQLSAAVFDRLGISEGYIMKFHQAKHNDADYLKKLKVLEYDILYGDKQIYDGKVPYVATDLKMGIDDITIDEVYDYKDYVCISGKNFNDFSTVYINNKEQENAELISSTMIRVPKRSIKSGDEIAIAQRGNDKIELGRTTYIVPN